jgi:hypothetical protein
MAVANNQQRKRRMAVGGAVLLVAVLGIQVPRTLKMINKSTAPPAAAETTTPSPVGVPAANAISLEEATAATSSLALGRRPARASARDLFAHNDAAISGAALGIPPKATQPGFAMWQPATVAAGRTQAPGRNAFTVVLRSVPQAAGRKAAEQAAKELRLLGVPGVDVVLSSKYASLASGYYVIVAGRFGSRQAALPALALARKAGVAKPYIRPLEA